MKRNSARCSSRHRVSSSWASSAWQKSRTPKSRPIRPAGKPKRSAGSALFQKGITVEPVRATRLVYIHYNSTDPGFAINAANGLADAFLNRNLETRFESSNYAKSYLEDQLKQLKLKLEDSEAQLVKFAEKEQIISTGGEETGSLAGAECRRLECGSGDRPSRTASRRRRVGSRRSQHRPGRLWRSGRGIGDQRPAASRAPN